MKKSFVSERSGELFVGLVVATLGGSLLVNSLMDQPEKAVTYPLEITPEDCVEGLVGEARYTPFSAPLTEDTDNPALVEATIRELAPEVCLPHTVSQPHAGVAVAECLTIEDIQSDKQVAVKVYVGDESKWLAERVIDAHFLPDTDYPLGAMCDSDNPFAPK